MQKACFRSSDWADKIKNSNSQESNSSLNFLKLVFFSAHRTVRNWDSHDDDVAKASHNVSSHTPFCMVRAEGKLIL